MQNNFIAVEKKLRDKYQETSDPWGLSVDRVLSDLEKIWPLYKHYFNVKLHGGEKIKDKPYMIISNHTGQIPIDGLLICTAFAKELENPRILRPLVERFLISLPFLGQWSHEGGAVLGDRQNCLNLLKKNESVLIFPEGVKGIAKNTKDFYKLQNFTKGFYRMAISAKAEIVPIAVIGAEEFFPYVIQMKKLANFLNLPALPLSANLIPLPSPVDIYIGDPIQIPSHFNEEPTDEEIAPHIEKIENSIQSMINLGLQNKRNFLSRFKGRP